MVTNAGHPGLQEQIEHVLADQGMPRPLPLATLCLTSFPHRQVPAGKPWVRRYGRTSLSIEPGTIHVQEDDGTVSRIQRGLPFGPRARIILLTFWSEIRRVGNREIERSSSLRHYLQRVGISAGGNTYVSFREQAYRIVGCRMLFAFRYERVFGLFELPIIQGGSSNRPDDIEAHAYETMMIGDRLFESMCETEVPIPDAALRRIANQSFAIDLYCWAATHIGAISEPLLFPWVSLHDQFGSAYAELRHFKPRFATGLALLSDLEPALRFQIDDEKGVTVLPPR